ncbi:hydroxyethylthiazole kinase [Bifidobacterium psychraerophilum]|uniref:hydroxyethylthiazole kinase n=1 Tax=Bifidobacterium psychraerophilum TaxID=218140 RepID=UPI0039E9D346
MSDSTSSAASSSTASSPTTQLASAKPLEADHPIRKAIEQAARQVRRQTPLAQSFTNFVTINLVANAQLAVGGTAAMSYLPDDIADVSAIAGATYINVGTLLPFFAEALPQIAKDLNASAKPWVLDPVAAGLGNTRTSILRSFKENPPTIVRGNASEIIALTHMWELDMGAEQADDADGTSRPAGVESVDDVDQARNAAVTLARFLSSRSATGTAAVAVSGAVDLVTDGVTVYRLSGGSELMTKITGAGCSLGGVTGTYLAVCDPITAAIAASVHFNRASQTAAETATGPGSFQTAFLDALWNTSATDIAKGAILIAE